MNTKLTQCALAALLSVDAAGTLSAQQAATGQQAMADQQTAAPPPAPTGRLEGVVADSVHDAVLSGVTVIARRVDGAEGIPHTTLTDRAGRYQLDLPPGRYSVSFASSLLDSLEYGVTPVVTTVAAGSVSSRANLAVPSGETLRAAACPGNGLARWTGALLGVVSDAESRRPLEGADVFVAWIEQAIDSTTRDIANRRRVENVKTNASGQYRMCGLPTDERLNVQIGYHGAVGPVAIVNVPDDIGVRVRNVAVRSQVQAGGDLSQVAQIIVEPPKPGRSSVAGRITRPDGQPLVGAQVRLLDGAVSTRSNEMGEFALSALPAGTHELEVRHLGYGLVRRPITLRDGEMLRENVALERVVSLDSMRVVAHRMSYPEFEKNRARYYRGQFMDLAEIKKRGYKTLPLLVQSVHGFRLVPQSRGRINLQSLYVNRCNAGSAGVEKLDPLNLVVDNMEHMDLTDVFFPIVEAVEIYAEGENAPFKYARACSVIVVWTKRSAKKPKTDTRDTLSTTAQ